MSPCNEENNAICGNLPSSMRPTCPSHLSLFAVMYADKVATPHDFLICSLVCRSDSLTPRMLLRQLEQIHAEDKEHCEAGRRGRCKGGDRKDELAVSVAGRV